jgi:hypothetical protein
LLTRCASFSNEPLRKLQGLVTLAVVEQEGDGVTQHLAKHSAHQMPEIFGPHLLYIVASYELRKTVSIR